MQVWHYSGWRREEKPLPWLILGHLQVVLVDLSRSWHMISHLSKEKLELGATPVEEKPPPFNPMLPNQEQFLAGNSPLE